MIVSMQKYSFLVYHANYQSFLKELKKIGVVHIEEKVKEPTLEMQDLFRQLNEVERSIRKLNSWESEPVPNELSFPDGKAVYQRLREIEKELEHSQHQSNHLDKEAKLLEPWGDFDWETIEKLEESGIGIHFLSCINKHYQPEWESQFTLKKISEAAGFSYFIKFDQEGDNGIADMPSVEELLLPHKSLNQVKAQMEEQQQIAKTLNREMAQIAVHWKKPLNTYLLELKDELQNKNALRQTSVEVEGKVQFLEGWVPETKKNELEQFLEEKRVLYTIAAPDDEDKVPILLKNNRFAKVYEVIGELYELPNHKELDLVPFFAPFYMMFFGFSLGDAGYGLIILLAATFLKTKMKDMRSVFTLAQWLGLATVIFGALTGTFFGINLIQAEVGWLESFKRYMIDTDKMFNLALVLGAIQILFGMVLKVINLSKAKGITYAFSTIGWLILLIGSGALFALKQGEVVPATVAGHIQTGILIVSGALILLFNHPKRNIVMNFLTGLWDVYGMVTGLVGDLLSYIRLFALGVSSAILGFVFNELAMSLKPDHFIFGPIVMLIILIFGHGITIFMASLGAFVHPIRLTFVEFYKNAGFTGGGKRYTPFAQNASEK